MPTIIKIEDFQFERKSRFLYQRLHKDRCAHRNMTMDDHGQTLVCSDCGKQVSAYWALNEFVDAYKRGMSRIETEKERLEEIKKEHQFLVVLKKIQKAWWGKKKMAVRCPWCKVGIMPEDGLGESLINPDIDVSRKRAIETRNSR